MRLVIYFTLGAVILVGTIGSYFFVGTAEQSNPASFDLAGFGSYFSDVAAPLLSFLALIAVADSLLLQRASIERDHERQLEEQHLRALDEQFRDIAELLDRPLTSTSDGLMTLRLLLEGAATDEQTESPYFRNRLSELLSLVAHYCEMVALYRENVSPYFDTKMYRDRGGRLLDSIKPFANHLDPLDGATIEFSDMHLRGDSRRGHSEAMHRSSRAR